MMINLKTHLKPLLNLPTPSNINYWWNMGSMLGVVFMSQILTGLLLTMYFTPHPNMAFLSISNYMQNINFGWLIRFMHSSGASMMMLCIYLHIGRNLYFSNFFNKFTGLSGIIMLFLTMMIAFLGYVLPWGQMSFWGATVITSLLSAIPKLGKIIVMWLWGNFAVSAPTLNRFFMLHFLLPMILTLMVLIHMMLLHNNGSMMNLNFKFNIEYLKFHPKFSIKDSLTIYMMLILLILISIMFPYNLMDAENFIIANPMSTPTHIQPEWYFLFSYAILRCIPNKMGGVLALLFSILWLLMPMLKSPMKSNAFNPLKKLYFWWFFFSILILMWIGASPVSDPLIFLGQIYSIVYFISLSFI